MKLHRKHLLPRLLRKAADVPCRYAVVAVGIDYRGRVISISSNRQRFMRRGGGIHAEQAIIHSSPRSLRRIVIARVRRGKLLPIEPCEKCKRMAGKFGVSIEAVTCTAN